MFHSLLLLIPLSTPQAEDAHQSYRAHLAAAQALLELERPARAAEWLDQAPADFRGWEWRHLKALTDRTERLIPAGSAAVISVEIAPDGFLAATAHGDGFLRLWQLPAWELAAEVRGHEDGAYTARFSPDGNLLLSASRDHTVRLWSVPELAELRVFRGHAQAVAGASFHPDGRRIVSCSWRRDPETNVAGQILLWSLDESVEPRELVAGVKPLSDARFDPAGARLATISWNGDLHLFALSGEGVTETIAPLPDYGIYRAADALAWSPDGARLAVGSRDGSVAIFAATGGEPLAAVAGSGEGLRAVAWSPDGSMLASAGQSALLRIWNSADLQPVDTLPGHSAFVRGISWTEREGLISCAADASIRCWPLPGTPSARLQFPSNRDGVWSLAFTLDDERVFGASFDGSVVEWLAADGTELRRWNAHSPRGCHGLSLAADGQSLLTTSWDGSARLWTASDGSARRSFTAANGGYDCELSPNGALAAATHGNRASVWDARSGTLLHEFEAGGSTSGLAFDAQSERLAIACGQAGILIWERKENVAPQRLEVGGPVSDLAFAPDGSTLATCGSDGALRLHDLASTSTRLLWMSDEDLLNLCWSPDGTRLAVTSEFLNLVDAQRGDLLLRLKPHRDSAWKASWSHDGNRLASCSSDGTVTILSAPAPR